MVSFSAFVVEVARKVLRRKPAGRSLTVFSDDVYLTSYPRSGNTWIRFLVANLAYPEHSPSFANIEDLIPAIRLFPNHNLLRRPRPRLLKSHEYFDHRYPKVIYIVRDPRDVAVSMYHYAIKRRDLADQYPIEKFVPRFVAGEFLNDFATWGEHVASWTATRGCSNTFLLVRYEDIIEDAIRELGRIAAFLRIPADRARLETAVECSSATQMRRLEKEQWNDWILTRQTRQDKAFIRDANSGGWTRSLTPASILAIETAWPVMMRKLGYSLVSQMAANSGQRCAEPRIKQNDEAGSDERSSLSTGPQSWGVPPRTPSKDGDAQ